MKQAKRVNIDLNIEHRSGKNLDIDDINNHFFVELKHLCKKYNFVIDGSVTRLPTNQLESDIDTGKITRIDKDGKIIL